MAFEIINHNFFSFKDGTTFRGCQTTGADVSSLIDCENSTISNGTQCFQCSSNQCNGQSTDHNWMALKLHDDQEEYCYECDSLKDPKCVVELNDLMLKRCPYFEQRHGCYHKIEHSSDSIEFKILNR